MTSGAEVAASRAGSRPLVYAMSGACGSVVTGGIATASRNVLHAFSSLSRERGCALAVYSLLEQPSDRPPFLPPEAQFEAFRGDKVRFSLALLTRAFERPLYGFDHVSLSAPLLPLAALGLARTLIFAHGSESWKRIERVNLWSFQQATLVLANSDFTLRKMRERFSGFPGQACPLGLSPDFALNATLPPPHTEPLVLAAADGRERPIGERALLLVGRLHPGEREKGHHALIEALPELVGEFPDLQLVFPGPGDDRENLMRFARDAGSGERVFIPGRISQELLEALYGRAYAFTMPSRQEGFGLVYLEAMNFGKPCVGCFDDGGEDVIAHGETGWLVRDPADRAELVSVLRRLLADPEQARSFGERGFQRLHELFTSEQTQRRVYASVGEVL